MPQVLQPRTRRRAIGLGLAVATICYFLWYIPYSAATKSLSSGTLPGWEEPISGFTILPAAGLGTFVGALAFVTCSGWWRHLRRRRILGRWVPLPAARAAGTGAATAAIIATTTLNYTFIGVSLLLILTLMRAGVLLLSPVVDLATRRSVGPASWIALTLSLLAIATTLTGAGSYQLPLVAVASLALYVTGYAARFAVMNAQAKRGVPDQNRRYLVNELLWAVIWQLAALAAVAVVAPGHTSREVREGFTSFLTTSAALPAFGIGLLYAGLFVFGTLIYLDRSEYSFCVPLNRCASVLSVVVASYGLTALLGADPPTVPQLVAAGIVLLALLVLTRAGVADTRGPAREDRPST